MERVRIDKHKLEAEEEASHDVGYGKPPLHSRFQPGQSGNPKGRPRGSRNLATDVKAVLNAPVRVTQDGKAKKVPTQKAALLRLCEKALLGDPRALDLFLALAKTYNNEELSEATATVSDNDEVLLEVLIERVRSGAISSKPAIGDAEVNSGSHDGANGEAAKGGD